MKELGFNIFKLCVSLSLAALSFINLFKDSYKYPVIDNSGNTVIETQVLRYSMLKYLGDSPVKILPFILLCLLIAAAVFAVLSMVYRENKGIGKAGNILFILSCISFAVVFIVIKVSVRKY